MKFYKVFYKKISNVRITIDVDFNDFYLLPSIRIIKEGSNGVSITFGFLFFSIRIFIERGYEF